MSHRVFIDGIALWAPTLHGWPSAAAALRGEAVAAARTTRPSPTLLAPNERRRAPDSVLVALAVAQAAVAQSGRDAAGLASVFTSAHADLAIVDALCSTLAAHPLMLSPTRFHNSVHNAASGYWAIATGCRAPSSAVSGYENSFAAGWLEAASQVAADGVPVLLVGFDTEAHGALASVNRSRGLLGVALVLSPQAGECSLWRVDWALGAGTPPPLRSAAARALAGNAMADALPLFETLAHAAPARVHLALGATPGLELALAPLAPPASPPGGALVA